MDDSRKSAEISFRKGLEFLQKPGEKDQEFGRSIVGGAVEKLFGNHQFAESIALLGEALESGKIAIEQREEVLQQAIRKELRLAEQWARGGDQFDPVAHVESHFGGNKELQGMALREVQQQNEARMSRLKEELSKLEQQNALVAAALAKEAQA